MCHECGYLVTRVNKLVLFGSDVAPASSIPGGACDCVRLHRDYD
jgi:hypothetical protein